MLRQLHHCPILSVAYDTEERWLYVNWHQPDTFTAIQSGGTILLRCVRRTGCRQLLNDNRQVCALWADSAEWVGRTFLPQLATAGVRQLAWINAHSIYGRISTGETLAYVEQPRTRLFDDYAEAVSWLRTG